MKEFWNERYAKEEYAYGTKPNDFFREQLREQEIQGPILFPAEGEGRNAVYAAQQGFSVRAFDISDSAKHKALKLAQDMEVDIDYEVGTFENLALPESAFGAAVLIYAHFPPHLKSEYHQQVVRLLKSGGLVILEGFSKNNLPLREKNPSVGGPGKAEMLFSEEEIQRDFPNFEALRLEEVEVELQEGQYHNGVARLIRFVGRKL